MRAMVVERPGERLRLVERPDRQPGRGQAVRRP